ncbi:GNAT family N-acetyltransferase [Mesonia sp. K7]|uniref:GNAT family N-acetyltransferase n=1 Tax=Mesonia sp. K7 TaxID=2218606 RepID=UPI000DA6FD8D|nr:GNAT family N-acetyltransferase [Mesonia sp. K7]PZD78491.1 GNAT family N-acetyltransferase [Mesonia sp. K7]
MHVKIRKATPEDMGQVLELIKELAHFEKEPDAVIVTEKQIIEDGFGDNPLFECFVAEKETKILGMALCYFRYSTWKGRTLHLEDLIVNENYRGKNIGLQLYKEVMQFATENQVKRVEWVVLDWNKNAIDFYQKTGAKVLEDWRIAQFDEASLQKFIQNS